MWETKGSNSNSCISCSYINMHSSIAQWWLAAFEILLQTSVPRRGPSPPHRHEIKTEQHNKKPWTHIHTYTHWFNSVYFFCPWSLQAWGKTVFKNNSNNKSINKTHTNKLVDIFFFTSYLQPILSKQLNCSAGAGSSFCAFCKNTERRTDKQKSPNGFRHDKVTIDQLGLCQGWDCVASVLFPSNSFSSSSYPLSLVSVFLKRRNKDRKSKISKCQAGEILHVCLRVRRGT